ncbi:hypothetical protein P261_00220 [Lachnospiraceae bacterium TWA4]|nr:hypothetical protein P261_00220 [Lachnospiraceae bacterium TWA4]
MTNQKIGIMGGTFSPIHIGHLILAQGACEEYQLDKIIFLPNKEPPHKANLKIVSGKHRANMVKLAIADNPKFEFSDIELRRTTGFSYTSDTLQEFCAKKSDSGLLFLVGADSLDYIEQWHEAETIFKLSHLLAAPRGALSIEEIDKKAQYLREKYGARVSLLHQPNIEISSNHIRNLRKNHLSIHYYVTREVENYIYENHLYED